MKVEGAFRAKGRLCVEGSGFPGRSGGSWVFSMGRIALSSAGDTHRRQLYIVKVAKIDGEYAWKVVQTYPDMEPR